MRKNFTFFLAAAFLLSPSVSWATKFTSQFCEFELPPQWSCLLEGAEWVCQSSEENRKRDAIIVLAAKLKGDQDSMPQYLSYLKNPKSFVSVGGKNVTSEAVYAREAQINGHPWIDAIHRDSEIPGFLTRYLATIKQDIGVLVTYSIVKSKYQEYLPDFDNMVKTLKVFRKSGALNAGGAGGDAMNPFANTTVPNGLNPESIFPGAGGQGAGSDRSNPVQRKEEFPLMYILLGVGAVLFIIWKKRKQNGPQ
ncbi:MAG: hypothetical protein JNL01_07890 [Bdellovibrionales bacterium]|nr:hypothetical protein [Bdellovibrionales bacterium]